MFKKIFLIVFLLHIVHLSISMKNGDVREFYVSAKNLPHVEGGTGNYLFAFVTGTLYVNGRQRWDEPVYSDVVNGNNPTWQNNLLNITYQSSYACYGFGCFGAWGNYKIAIFERLTTGRDELLMGIWHWDTNIIDFVDKSCQTKQPYEVNYTNSYPKYNFTYYYHCTSPYNV